MIYKASIFGKGLPTNKRIISLKEIASIAPDTALIDFLLSHREIDIIEEPILHGYSTRSNFVDVYVEATTTANAALLVEKEFCR